MRARCFRMMRRCLVPCHPAFSFLHPLFAATAGFFHWHPHPHPDTSWLPPLGGQPPELPPPTLPTTLASALGWPRNLATPRLLFKGWIYVALTLWDIWWGYAIQKFPLCFFSTGTQVFTGLPWRCLLTSCQPTSTSLGESFWWNFYNSPLGLSDFPQIKARTVICITFSVQMLLACPPQQPPPLSEIKIISLVTVSSLILLDTDYCKW